MHKLEEAEKAISDSLKLKQQLNCKLEDAQLLAENETQMKVCLSQQLKNALQDVQCFKEQFENESELRIELQKSLLKASNEMHVWKCKYEVEGLARAEELEELKKKLAISLNAAEEQVDQALAKCTGLEKTKQRLQAEIEDLLIDVERLHRLFC